MSRSTPKAYGGTAGLTSDPRNPARNVTWVALTRKHPVLAYTLARLALFGAAYGLLWLTGLRNQLYLAVLALLASGIVSMWLLARQRDAVSSAVSEWFAGFDASARAEDDEAETRSRRPSTEREAESEQQTVGQLDTSGVAQRRDERGAFRAGEDRP